MEFSDLTRDDIVFAYQTSPIYGREGEDGGFAITVYGNGNLRYCTYTFYENINSLQMFKLEKEDVREIYDIIQQEKENLQEVPARLDNGSREGHSNEFEFLGMEKIIAWNIKETILPIAMLTKKSHYQEYQNNMRYENTVLKAFKAICRSLRKTGIRLDLHSCEVDGDFKLKVTW